MTNDQIIKLADELEDLAAMLTMRAQRFRKLVRPTPDEELPILRAIEARSQRITNAVRTKKWLP